MSIGLFVAQVGPQKIEAPAPEQGFIAEAWLKPNVSYRAKGGKASGYFYGQKRRFNQARSVAASLRARGLV